MEPKKLQMPYPDCRTVKFDNINYGVVAINTKEVKMEPKIRMPYGKFKGKEMHEIPSPYLKWLAENVGETLAVAADEEWRWRDTMQQHWED